IYLSLSLLALHSPLPPRSTHFPYTTLFRSHFHIKRLINQSYWIKSKFLFYFFKHFFRVILIIYCFIIFFCINLCIFSTIHPLLYRFSHKSPVTKTRYPYPNHCDKCHSKGDDCLFPSFSHAYFWGLASLCGLDFGLTFRLPFFCACRQFQ